MKNKIPIKRRQDIIFYHQNKKRHCEICGKTKGLTVHHKIPKELGGLDNIENLMTLRLNLLKERNGIQRI